MAQQFPSPLASNLSFQSTTIFRTYQEKPQEVCSPKDQKETQDRYTQNGNTTQVECSPDSLPRGQARAHDLQGASGERPQSYVSCHLLTGGQLGTSLFYVENHHLLCCSGLREKDRKHGVWSEQNSKFKGNSGIRNPEVSL